MKTTILCLASLLSFSAFGAEKYVCNQYNRENEKILQTTAVLTPAQEGEVQEGVPHPYRLALFNGANAVEELESEGVVMLEDVMFEFKSTDAKKARFMLYLDEMEESSLSIAGEEKGDFICR